MTLAQYQVTLPVTSDSRQNELWPTVHISATITYVLLNLPQLQYGWLSRIKKTGHERLPLSPFQSMSSAKMIVPQIADNQPATFPSPQKDILPILSKDLNYNYVKLLK